MTTVQLTVSVYGYDDNEAINVSSYFTGSSNSTSPFNLGIYYREKIDENQQVIPELYAKNYIGLTPLINKNGNINKKVVLSISSRFDISPTNMLKTILEGDDYYDNPDFLKTYSHKSQDWKKMATSKNDTESKILFGVITGFGQIDLENADGSGNQSGKSDANVSNDVLGVFEIIDFVNKAKEICMKNLKRQSQRVEENLTCKVKGRILIQKQIKYNETKGQRQKVYCAYNKMSPDIKENQIIKYALHLCKKHAIGDALAEDISLCMRALSGIPLKKCSAADFIGLKNNGAYREYKEALIAAKRIITNYYINYSDNSGDHKDGELRLLNNKIQPYYINMDLLFEHYCRALFRKAIDRYNEKLGYFIFELESVKDAKRRLHEEHRLESVFMPTYIPDIVIKYKKDGVNKVVAVIDAKDSNLIEQNSEKRRARTHQVLFYMKSLGCDCGGLISPCEYESIKKLDPDMNNEPITAEMFLDGERESSNMKLTYIPFCFGYPDPIDDIEEKYIETVTNYLKELEKYIKDKTVKEKAKDE